MTIFGETLSTIYTEYFYRKNRLDSSGLWSSIHHCIVQRNIRSFCILQDINTRHCLYLIIMACVSFVKWGRKVRRQTRTPGVSTGWWVRHTVIYAYIYKCIHIRVYIYIKLKNVYICLYIHNWKKPHNLPSFEESTQANTKLFLFISILTVSWRICLLGDLGG